MQPNCFQRLTANTTHLSEYGFKHQDIPWVKNLDNLNYIVNLYYNGKTKLKIEMISGV